MNKIPMSRTIHAAISPILVSHVFSSVTGFWWNLFIVNNQITEIFFKSIISNRCHSYEMKNYQKSESFHHEQRCDLRNTISEWINCKRTRILIIKRRFF